MNTPLGSPAQNQPVSLVVCWEFADGSFQSVTVPEDEADALADQVCKACPDARVWVGDDQIQIGFLAADDLGSLF